MTRKTLVVAVRGWTTTGDFLLLGKRGGELRSDFLEALAAELENTEVWAPDLDLTMFCMRSAESLSRELFGQIERKLQSVPDTESIILVGYSAGSLLVRRVFCMAHGARLDGTVGQQTASWADKIDRVVMLSGITRGWEQSSAAPAHVRFISPILHSAARMVGWLKQMGRTAEAREPFIHQLRRGSPFVVSTRIQYVNVLETLRARSHPVHTTSLRANGLPSTVFILGAKDEYVSPADCTELGPRIEFAFIELSGSNHTEAILIDGLDPVAVERRKRLVAAITLEFETLKRDDCAVPSSDIDDYLDPMDLLSSESGDTSSGKIDHVIMVMHGIRDNGFWTKRVARQIKTLARTRGLVVRAPTPSYGYFSMLDFIRFGGRDQATCWFMERYADIRSHSPNALISFVGHSNGTYVAAHALERCEAISFEYIVFAGSVVRRNFPWSRYAGRVRAILNYVGSRDSVVAFLPAVFELIRLPWLDVGGAGAFGFDEADPRSTRAPREPDSAPLPQLNECRFVPGGHSGAIGEQYWREIAAFALQGTLPTQKRVVRSELTRWFFRCAPIATATLGVALLALLLSPFITVTFAIWESLSIAWILVALALSIFVSWVVGRFLRQW